jgi:gluconolactonase
MKTATRIASILSLITAASAQAEAPLASVDLLQPARAALVGATWRYSDARAVGTTFRAPGGDGQPGQVLVTTQVIEPRAGRAEYDDRAWPVIPADELNRRRGTGHVSFGWYRLEFKVPESIDGVSVAGKSLWFESRLDDYAEVWVNGEIGRAYGQHGGSVVAGWSAPNRVLAAREARPGQVVRVAVFGMNGPISDAPTNYIYFHAAKLDLVDGATGPVAVTPHEVNVRVERVDPALDAIVPANPKLWKLAEGFRFTEGPVWVRDGGYLLFSDPNANRIYQYSD